MTPRRLSLASSLRAEAARFLLDRRGATIVEYALISAFVSMAVLAIYDDLGSKIATFFQSAGTQISDG